MAIQKLTLKVDRDLLRRAQERTGKGVTATIHQGLKLVAAASDVYDRLRALRGHVSFSIDPEKPRGDRRRTRR